MVNGYEFAHPTTSRFPIPDSRFPIPDSRFPIPDSRFPLPDSRFPISDSRFPIPMNSPQLKPAFNLFVFSHFLQLFI
ncbi:hypothetical protein, partial [Moorena sp. SIO2C4]|uniref:hypothetical protein n=1 Tax=Moorena sp. SIO2C4 TaxID=2607824 RepID=UPI0013C6EF5C